MAARKVLNREQLLVQLKAAQLELERVTDRRAQLIREIDRLDRELIKQAREKARAK